MQDLSGINLCKMCYNSLCFEEEVVNGIDIHVDSSGGAREETYPLPGRKNAELGMKYVNAD